MNRKERRAGKEAVCVAYVHGVEVAHSFMTSWVNLILHDFMTERHVARGGYMANRYGTGGIEDARNQVAAEILKRKHVDWLMWFDSDMGFEKDTVSRLVAAADPKERPILGGLCFANKETDEDGLGGYKTSPRVTVYDRVQLEDGTLASRGVRKYEKDAVVWTPHTGSACLLIHRTVFERIHEEYGPTWYDRIRGDDGGKLGEDVSFCVRAGALGIPTHVHTGVRTNHLKHIWVSEDTFDFHHAGWSELQKAAVDLGAPA